MLAQLFTYISILTFVFLFDRKPCAYLLLTTRSFHQNVDNYSSFVIFFSKNFPRLSISGSLSCIPPVLLELGSTIGITGDLVKA